MSTIIKGGASNVLAEVKLPNTAPTVTDQPLVVSTHPLSQPAVGVALDGTDGATPPSIPGTGIRGWLRSIYDILTQGVAVTGTFWQSVQPISGTVTANIGTADGIAQDVTLTSGAQKTQITNFPVTQPVTGTFFQALQPVSTAPAPAPTYFASSVFFTPATTATDIFTISGSATKVIKIIEITLWGSATATTSETTYTLIKRSAVDTGGTAVAEIRVPSDSTQAAATATVQHYTANPTALGAVVGTIFQPHVAVPITTLGGPIFDWRPDLVATGPITLRGVAETLAVNLGGATVPTGASYAVQVIWTEA